MNIPIGQNCLNKKNTLEYLVPPPTKWGQNNKAWGMQLTFTFPNLNCGFVNDTALLSLLSRTNINLNIAGRLPENSRDRRLGPSMN